MVGVRLFMGKGLAGSLINVALLVAAVGGATAIAVSDRGELFGFVGTAASYEESVRAELGSFTKLDAAINFGAGNLSIGALPPGDPDAYRGLLSGHG